MALGLFYWTQISTSGSTRKLVVGAWTSVLWRSGTSPPLTQSPDCGAPWTSSWVPRLDHSAEPANWTLGARGLLRWSSLPTMANVTRDYRQSAQFLKLLFGTGPPEGFLEIRTIAPAGRVTQLFFRLHDLQLHGFQLVLPRREDGKANVHFSACLRARKSGTSSDVQRGVTAWADLDRGLPDPWPDGVPRPTAMVLTSPGSGKAQMFWVFAILLRTCPD